MTERPIIFSSPMVRAILDGRKTQTRRIVTPQPSAGVRQSPFVPSGLEDGHGREIRARYGRPGDLLWVRETFQPIIADGFDWGTVDWKTGRGYAVRYVATDGVIEFEDEYEEVSDRCTPSIHMPRWASRITLEVTGVCVERLQDISEEDAKAEGTQEPTLIALGGDLAQAAMSERQVFMRLWNRLNGSGSWAANPWVWVIEFRRIKP